MLRGARFYLSLLHVSLLLLASGYLPVAAQINGVPASVTSFGFGGSNNPAPGIRASVTSLGPNGYGNSRSFFGNCCSFFPLNNSFPGTRPPFRPHRDRDARDHGRDHFALVPYPAYIPYSAGNYDPSYATDAADEEEMATFSSDFESGYRERNDTRFSRPTARRNATNTSSRDKLSEPAPTPTVEEPVVQPSTVLVFKDGHHSDVINYAIVGDTLFDFDEGRTRKVLLADLDLPATQRANDERGVEFGIPAR